MITARLNFMKWQVIMFVQIFQYKGNYCLYLKSVSKQGTLQLYKKSIYNRPRFLQGNSAIVGDVVLIKEESIPRMKWHKGKIIELILGNNTRLEE